MPTPFKFTVKLNISRELLWRVRASKTFMSFLVSDGALNRMDATPPKVPSDATSPSARTRKQTYVPANVIIPDMIKSIIDDSYIEISDCQTWDENNPFVQHSVVKPTILGDVVTTTATLTMSEDEQENNVCVHTLAGTVTVLVPFLGYYVEQAVVSNMQQFYTDYASHVSNFVQMVISKYGDGTMSSLPRAVDHILAEEKVL